MLKKLLLAGAASTVMVGSAFAADIEEPVAVFDWSGFYVGLNAGWDWKDVDASVDIPDDSNINAGARALAEEVLDGNVDSDGFTGGLTLGVNHQMDNLVVGIEGDVNFLDNDETREETLDLGNVARGTDDMDSNILATLRLRLGLAMDQTLFYITGGGAYTDTEINRTLDWDFADGCPPVDAGLQRCHEGDAEFDFGWVVGAGVEHAFDENWSIKVEYLYADFGEEDFTTLNEGNVDDQVMEHSFDLQMHIVRAGLNWRF